MELDPFGVYDGYSSPLVYVPMAYPGGEYGRVLGISAPTLTP